MKISPLVLWLLITGAGFVGSAVRGHLDHSAIVKAQQNEMQAQGLEDQCKVALAAQHPVMVWGLDQNGAVNAAGINGSVKVTK